LKAYRFLDDAETELQEQIAYLNERSAGLGTRFVAEIASALLDIRQHPEIGPRITRRVRRRVLQVFHYSLIYVNQQDELVIIAIAPHSRRPGYWRKRLRKLDR
jgi:toxin ParE1/3/4